MENDPRRIAFKSDAATRWVGMADAVLVSPDGRHELLLRYIGEPPHGDSYHEGYLDGLRVPGWFWGGMFAFTPDSRFVVGSWMPERYERRTIVVDIAEYRYFLLPNYIYDFVLQGSLVQGIGPYSALEYDFGGEEIWTPF